jgi:hypothetical protein
LEKIVKFIFQTVLYFIIVLFIFFIVKQIGINSDMSIWAGAIGSTVGWVIVQGVFILKKKNNNK